HHLYLILSELVLLAGFYIRRTGTGFTDPVCICIRRNRKTEVCHTGENRTACFLGAVFIACHYCTEHFVVIFGLSILCSFRALRINPFHDGCCETAFMAVPDRCTDHNDVRIIYLPENFRPLVTAA